MRMPRRPGEILSEEFLIPLGLSVEQFAAEVGATVERVDAVIQGEEGITARDAALFARRLGTTARFWLNLQTACDQSRSAS